MTKSPKAGPKVDSVTHEALARWAATCAERTLPIFEECCPDDTRPRNAIESLRGWVRGDLSMIACRTAAFAAHAAARDAAQAGAPAAVAAARAAGQAAAVAHMSAHCAHAAMYAAKAAGLHGVGEPTRKAERVWQWDNLDPTLRVVGFPRCL
ncbi:putative immunity protein [Mycolicibacterium sp. P1-18]|uniref:putative immunity protein n=1 Tax=Mycolicibacterium sp. P1-18 TaxID=2024615 RepID=UPI0011F29430|nr:hypothetical protein [Mycolicibacterium sp. P1-18]